MALGHWADGLSIATKSLILDRELEELTGRRHVVRQPGHAVAPKSSGGTGRRFFADRWRAPVDLRWPSPGLGGRPKSASGATSFHMRVTTSSRPAEGAGSSKKSSSGNGHGAASFDIYITDGLAPKQIDGAGFDRYAADGLSPHDPEPEQGSRVAFMITNIDDDPDRRTAFWEERHHAARRRGDHAIELVPGRGSIEQWRALNDDEHMPSGVRDAVTIIVSALAAEPHFSDRNARPKNQRVRLEAASDIAWAAELGERFGIEKTQRMLHYVRPRGGQVQHRFEVEIPAGLDRAGVLQIASDFAALVGSLKLPFLIAVHRPDADNDPRNWHLHLIYYPQPGEQHPDGKWMFGKAAESGMLRPGDIARSLNRDEIVAPGAWYKTGAAADLRALREGYADICNSVLERADDSRRLDARSFEDMGVAKRPERHLGTDEARLFFTGVATATSRFNATCSWEWIIRQRYANIDASYNRLMAPIEAQRGFGDVDEDLRRKRDRLIAERDALAADRRELVLVDARLELARSSAKRVKANCEQTLERIAAGDAAHSDVRSADAIRARLRLAEHHLVEIADAVEPWLDQKEVFRLGLEQQEEGLRYGVLAWLEQAQEQSRRTENTPSVHRVEPEVIAGKQAKELGPVAGEQSAAERPVEAAAERRPATILTEKEQLEMDRLLAAVRANGVEATRDATRGKTSTPRAVAKLYLRYHAHPYFVARVAPAEREWSEKIIRQADEIARRVAAMTAPSARPVGQPHEVVAMASAPGPLADRSSSISTAAGDPGPAVVIPIAMTRAEAIKADVTGADDMQAVPRAVVGDEPVPGFHREPAEAQAGEPTVSTKLEPLIKQPMLAQPAARSSGPADGHGTMTGTPVETVTIRQTPPDQTKVDRVTINRAEPSREGADPAAVFGAADDVARRRTAFSSSASDRVTAPEKIKKPPRPPVPAAAQDEIVKPALSITREAERDEHSSATAPPPSALGGDVGKTQSGESVVADQSAERPRSKMDIARAAAVARSRPGADGSHGKRGIGEPEKFVGAIGSRVRRSRRSADRGCRTKAGG